MAVLRSDNELLIPFHSFGEAVHMFSLAQRLEHWPVTCEKLKLLNRHYNIPVVDHERGFFYIEPSISAKPQTLFLAFDGIIDV